MIISMPQSRVDLTRNLEAYYRCNDNAANTTVTNEKGTNGTASTNTTNLSTAGRFYKAFDFLASSSEYIDTNLDFSTIFAAPFSVSCWIKPNDGQPTGTQFVYGVKHASNGWFQLSVAADGTLFVYYENSTGNAQVSSSVIFPNGATSWAHIVVTLDATNLKIYADTAEVASTSSAGVTLGNYSTTDNLFIGARNTAGAEFFFDGLIDHLRIYSEILSAPKMRALYRMGTSVRILDSYSESNRDNYSSIGVAASRVGTGQAFTLATAKTITYSRFFVGKQGSPTGNVVAKIYTATGTVGSSAKPTGSALATSDAKDVTTLPGSYTLHDFIFPTPVALSAGDYCIVLEYSTGFIANRLLVGIDGSSPAHYGNFCFSADLITWVAASSSDHPFYLFGY